MKKPYYALFALSLLVPAAYADDAGKNAMSMDKPAMDGGTMMKRDAADPQAMQKKNHLKKKDKTETKDKAMTPDGSMSGDAMKMK